MMTKKFDNAFGRRAFLAGGAALLASPALVQAQTMNSAETVEMERDLSQAVRRNASSFRTLDWRPYFS
ncbi:hypothetical protein RZS08_63060, partial [Arthrospira platensis SPKY1]|nr:hypothetical protein [Arthrospira platensis SPKY1]